MGGDRGHRRRAVEGALEGLEELVRGERLLDEEKVRARTHERGAERWRMRSFVLLFSVLFVLPGATHAQGSTEAVGLWWVAHGDGQPLQIRIYADGSCWSDYPANNPGRWRMEGSEVICLWADGWKERLVPRNGGWINYGYTPESPLAGPPSHRTRAVRVSERPDGWLGYPPPSFR